MKTILGFKVAKLECKEIVHYSLWKNTKMGPHALSDGINKEKSQKNQFKTNFSHLKKNQSVEGPKFNFFNLFFFFPQTFGDFGITRKLIFLGVFFFLITHGKFTTEKCLWTKSDKLWLP